MMKTRHYCDWCGKEIECADTIISYPTPTREENGHTVVFPVGRPGPEELCSECAHCVYSLKRGIKRHTDEENDNVPVLNRM